MNHTFDPAVLGQIVKAALVAWSADRAAAGPTGRPDQTWLEKLFDRVRAGIAARWPGETSASTQWILAAAGGGTQQLLIVHASFTEYLTLVGSPIPTQGFSGRYFTEIYDFILDGELVNYAPGQLTPTSYKPGDVSYFARGEGRNYAIPDRLWMLEYSRGPIPTMFALPLADTVFGTLDYRSLFDLSVEFVKQMRLPFKARWRNWAGNQRCEPQRIFRPESLEDLQQIVKLASAEGRKVRVYGARHSWTKLVPNDEYLVDMTRLDRPLDADTANRTVRVESGTRLRELTRYAAEHDLVVSSPTVAVHFTVGGMLATNSHGSGLGHSTFADTAVRITVVRHDGEVVDIDAGHEDIYAARANLGALGIVYAITFACQPETNFLYATHVVPLKEAIERIPELIKEYASVDMAWFPYTDKALLRLAKPTTDPVTYTPLLRAQTILRQVLVDATLGMAGIQLITRVAPRLTPAFTWLIAAATTNSEWVMAPRDAFHYQYFYPKVWDGSFAVPLDRAQDAWHAFVDLVESYRARGQYPINMLVYSRFVGESNTWISPAFRRETCFIEAVTSVQTKAALPFYRDLERLMEGSFEGRPHWAKVWFDVARVRQIHGNSLKAFELVRRRWDPNGVFLNGFLAELLGPIQEALVGFTGTVDDLLPPPTEAPAPPLPPSPSPSPPSRSPVWRVQHLLGGFVRATPVFG